jgi:hypothetical protein
MSALTGLEFVSKKSAFNPCFICGFPYAPPFQITVPWGMMAFLGMMTMPSRM